MNMQQLGRGAAFLAGTIVGGLALAFVVVFLRPDLLPRSRPATANVAAPSPDSRPAPAGRSDSGVATSAAPAAGESATIRPHQFAGAVQRAAPAVVNIYTARVVTERVQPSPIDQLFGDLLPRYQQRVQRALGSGVIVDASGHVITNHHVIADASTINVQLADGRVTAAAVVGKDPDTDLALLSIKLDRLPVMPLGRSDQVQVGDEVLAIGNPLGLQQTVTHGIVSATGRSQLGVATFENFIQTDAAINEGNSGGALVNTTGELIGINTAVIAKNMGSTGIEGIGFAIPVNLVRGVMAAILKQGRVIRGWIGIVPEDITDSQAQQLGLARGGVVVTNLYRGSPALDAGLRPGDIVLAIGGQAVRNAQDALAKLADYKPGATVKLRIQRGAETSDVNCRIGERPVIS
jgi:Do/DeqQ family serine protease